MRFRWILRISLIISFDLMRLSKKSNRQSTLMGKFSPLDFFWLITAFQWRKNGVFVRTMKQKASFLICSATEGNCLKISFISFATLLLDRLASALIIFNRYSNPLQGIFCTYK